MHTRVLLRTTWKPIQSQMTRNCTSVNSMARHMLIRNLWCCTWTPTLGQMFISVMSVASLWVPKNISSSTAEFILVRKLIYVTSVGRLLLRVATLNSTVVFTLGSVRLNVRYVAKRLLTMPLWQYIDGFTQVRDHTSVNGVSMSSFARLFSQFTKSCVKLRCLKTWYDGLLGWIFSMMFCWEKLYYAVWNGECIWQHFCIFCLVKAVYFQAPLYLLGLTFHTVSEHMVAVVYVLYKIAFIYLGYTLLISWVIIGIIKCKDCARVVWFPNLCLSCHLSGATAKDHENLRSVRLRTWI